MWWERKVSARVQLRLGPQQAGPAGLLQTLADTIKLVLKEDITPANADRPMFRMAPFLVFVPIATSLIVLPVVLGWAPLQIATGALFFLAVPGISAAGILLAGWSSRNTYATIGGIRGAAQVVSYELPRTLSVLALCVLGGTLNVVTLQESWRWWWIAVVRARLPGVLHRVDRRAQPRPVRPVPRPSPSWSPASSPITPASGGPCS